MSAVYLSVVCRCPVVVVRICVQCGLLNIHDVGNIYVCCVSTSVVVIRICVRCGLSNVHDIGNIYIYIYIYIYILSTSGGCGTYLHSM